MKSALLILIFLTGVIMTMGENGKPAAGLTGPQTLEGKVVFHSCNFNVYRILKNFLDANFRDNC